MSAAALEAYLHANIPLTRAMAVSAVSAHAESVTLSAPLDPNINVHGTAFGGSVSTLGVLAAWSVVHLRLEAEAVDAQLVIHRNETEFLAPITGRFEAFARIEPQAWTDFRTVFDRRGKARLSVVAELLFEGRVAARMIGEFVALRDRS
ncbi:Putative thioesterase (yiiD_Cterm) [Devosia equisanguinis]|uniref:Thioesterase (YiiD_Cterm) n=1 Tax=Devosia equisanguinis TaxID=2490941 RepID=A0A447IFG1_9HYPH|nr:YiiD C-terminal domain-containing protein [Devosia equisanguinis]VDS06221.1 Putative thioesterase (yiiD_Cterm) [Devosia equisanguinis]